MPSLREYFETEAAARLDRLDALASADDEIDGAGLHQHARALRGAAQLAGAEYAYRAALGLESALRSLAQNEVAWDDDTRGRIRMSLADLRRLVRLEDPEEAETCVAGVLERCLALGIEARATAGSQPEPAPDDKEAEARRAFRAFAQVEVGSIADTIQAAIDAFGADPMNRDALKRVLRRQRALLGAARLPEIPILGETLHAIEDLAAVIAKMDVPVKNEWLDVFRSGRDVLRDAHERLVEGEDPRPITALSRLRTLRDELLERYGTAEVVSTAAPDRLVQAVRATDAAPAEAPFVAVAPAAPVAPATERPDGRVAAGPMASPRPAAPTDAERLAALRRALELRARIEPAIADADARAALAEVFDLIQAALG